MSEFKGRPLRVTMIPTSRWTACPGDSVSDYPADYRYTCSNTHESPASSHRACLAGCLEFLLKNPENNHNKIVIHDFHWSMQVYLKVYIASYDGNCNTVKDKWSVAIPNE